MVSTQGPRHPLGKLERPACLRHMTAKVNSVALLQSPRSFQTAELMLPRPNTVYEIRETSTMRVTNEDEIVVSGNRSKTVMEGSCDRICFPIQIPYFALSPGKQHKGERDL